MGFNISKGSNVDLGISKVNFYDYSLEKIGLLLKDTSKLSGKEMVTLFNLIQRLCDKKENQIELDNDDMEFVKKHIGDIK